MQKSPATSEGTSSVSSIDAPQDVKSCVVAIQRLASPDLPAMPRIESTSEDSFMTDITDENDQTTLLSPLFFPQIEDAKKENFVFDENINKEAGKSATPSVDELKVPEVVNDQTNKNIIPTSNAEQVAQPVTSNVKAVARKSTGQKAYAHKSTGGKFFITSRLAAGMIFMLYIVVYVHRYLFKKFLNGGMTECFEIFHNRRRV